VLLVHGTGSNPHDNFSWNWEPALDDLSIAWCTVALPGNGMTDVQVGGEYVVNAIRTMYAQAGRRISIIGHSQGGMIPRAALRYWPDTRAMVNDQIGIAPSNHGTTGAQLTCIPDCAPAVWQQRDDSQFIKALNSDQETFKGDLLHGDLQPQRRDRHPRTPTTRAAPRCTPGTARSRTSRYRTSARWSRRPSDGRHAGSGRL
jgi:pimeloyl-ACP methyl ester carboxylesterase